MLRGLPYWVPGGGKAGGRGRFSSRRRRAWRAFRSAVKSPVYQLIVALAALSQKSLNVSLHITQRGMLCGRRAINVGERAD